MSEKPRVGSKIISFSPYFNQTLFKPLIKNFSRGSEDTFANKNMPFTMENISF